MNYLKNIITQMEDLSGIKDIVGASEEIASMKMRGIRNKVLQSRDLNKDLTEIYREVSVTYKNQIINLIQEKKLSDKLTPTDVNKLSLKSGNGKFACVYLSANSGLFSNILEQTYREFIVYLEGHKEAIPVIIGEFGKKLFTNNFPDRNFVFYPLGEGNATEDSLQKIIRELSEYTNVIIYYARFKSMAEQTTTVLDVSSSNDTTQLHDEIPISHYLFEPSLEKILAFFESEIFAGIIQQTITESDLARYASRITTLDLARENINMQLKIASLEKRFAIHRIMNKKQNEAITGISLWKIT